MQAVAARRITAAATGSSGRRSAEWVPPQMHPAPPHPGSHAPSAAHILLDARPGVEGHQVVAAQGGDAVAHRLKVIQDRHPGGRGVGCGGDKAPRVLQCQSHAWHAMHPAAKPRCPAHLKLKRRCSWAPSMTQLMLVMGQRLFSTAPATASAAAYVYVRETRCLGLPRARVRMHG